MTTIFLCLYFNGNKQVNPDYFLSPMDVAQEALEITPHVLF